MVSVTPARLVSNLVVADLELLTILFPPLSAEITGLCSTASYAVLGTESRVWCALHKHPTIELATPSALLF